MLAWACFHTLKILRLQLQGGYALNLSAQDLTAIDPDRVALCPKAHPDVLWLYGHLSNLTQSESFLIGVRHGESFALFTEAGLVGFDFSMQSGLPILKTLKHLKSLQFYQKSAFFDPWDRESGNYGLYEPQIGPEEAKWMIQHWPSLTKIQQWEVEKGPNVEVRVVREAAQTATRIMTEIEARINAMKVTLSRDVATKVLAEAEGTFLELEQARKEALHAAEQALAQAAEKAGDIEVGPVTDWRLLKTCFPERVHVWTDV